MVISSIPLLLISAIFALVFVLCLRLKAPPYIFLILLISPFVVLPLVNPKWAVAGWHEFMHASFVYNILNGMVPPEDVLLAGYPLKYSWIHHYLVAWLCQIARIAPPLGFAIFNILALVISAIAIFKTAQLLDTTRQTGIFAVFLALFGTALYLPETKISPDLRIFPLHKFASANSNPVGYCLFFIGLFFLIRLLANRGKYSMNGIGVFLSILGLAFLYPIFWLAMDVTCIVVGLGQGIVTKGKNWRSIVIVLLASFFGSALAMPYIYLVSSGKASTAEMTLNFLWRGRIFAITLVLCIPLLMMWLNRQYLRSLFTDKPSEVLTLAFASIALILLYIFVTIPTAADYKFLMLLMAVFGILSAPTFARFFQKRFIWLFPIIVLFSFPTVQDFNFMFTQERFVDPAYVRGIDIRHDDPARDKLYSWIATRTPVDTVAIDSFLSIPPLSHRSLYVATELRKKIVEYDGWLVNANLLSTHVLGQPQEVVKRRLKNAIALLTPNSQQSMNAAAEDIKKEFARRQVIVIVRDPLVEKAFEKNSHFTKIFQDRSSWIYRLKS